MRRRQAIVLLALVGLLIALYLWLYKLGFIGTLQCGTGSCEYVQTSRYAELLGMPVAFYGVGGYAVLFVVGLAGVQPRFVADRRVALLLAALSSLGLAFTVYLTYIELFVLRAVCRWCVASAVIITALWALSMWDVRRRA
jgi:uncharacterized membrane protein